MRGYLFGTGLSKLAEYDITFVVLDHGQPEVEQFGNIRVYRHTYYKTYQTFVEKLPCRKLFSTFHFSESNPLFIDQYRIDHKKISGYEKVNADVYCTFGVSNFSAEVAAFCKKYEKKFVLFLGSGEDVSSKYYNGSKETNSYGSVGHLCYYTINQSDLIISQTKRQSDLVWERYHKNSTIIHNPIDLSTTFDNDKGTSKEQFALWIGKSDKVKRPDILLQLAKNIKDIKFVMVLNTSDRQIHEIIIRGKSGNVELHEYIPINEIERLFINAFVLVNTSDFEGFPNTFLQAGKYDVPILSLNVDPDNFISLNKCGVVAGGNFGKLLEGLQIISTDKKIREFYSKNIKEYVYKNHKLEDKVQELNAALKGL